MKDYRKVLDFRFNNKKYVLLIDNENKFFFLEIKNNQYCYITLKELLILGKMFTQTPKIASAKKEGKKMKLIPKVLIGTTAVTLSLGMTLVIPETIKEIKNNINPPSITQYVYEEEKIADPTHLSFAIEDNSEDLVVDTFLESDFMNYTYVYDNEYLDKILDIKDISKEDLLKVLNDNPNISTQYKTLISKFINDYVEKQPNAERRILYTNLKTLKITECDKYDLILSSLSIDSAACYVRNENTIYVLKDYEYKPHTWEYQVLYHELCHVARTGYWDTNNKQLRAQCEGLNFYNVTSSEALNSLFAVSLFDYEENDIAYQLQSNYYKVLLKNMNTYKIEDYMNKSLAYFAKCLDIEHGDNNYATIILNIIEAQYNDYHNDNIEIEQSEYYPLYDYICDFYFKNNINANMTYEEAKEKMDTLIKEITFDVPEDYNLDINHFYNYFEEYIASLNISNLIR